MTSSNHDAVKQSINLLVHTCHESFVVAGWRKNTDTSTRKLKLDLGGAVVEKLVYNASRQDHKPENRAAAGGKAY